MRARLVMRRQQAVLPSSNPRLICTRSFANQTKFTSTTSRPSLPFLLVPKASPSIARSFTSERKRWLKHEAKLVVRYTITVWGLAICGILIFFAVNEETSERESPTPHEWHYLTRKFLRDAQSCRDPKDGEVNWARCLELARGVVIRLEDPKLGGDNVVKLSDKVDPSLEVPGEFISCDISAKSEEWRRGYFEAIMLAAKAAEHVDGWLRDTTRNVVSAPEFVIGPSNPRPKPIPPGRPHAPREEDCEPAYPAADSWYVKILATTGLSPRQKMEAALEYATFMEFKHRQEGSEALYSLALAEASTGLDPSKLPYDPKTFIVKSNAPAPSMNVLDALTAIANYKARRGDVSSALPIYISLLKARRSLSDTPPPAIRTEPKMLSPYERFVRFFGPPAYPAPAPDGTQPPWRTPYERCQEASLDLYIGEILYATSSEDEGLAWTRDGVDLAEEQLRALGSASKDKETKQICRECLGTGLENWTTMVSLLAKAEEARNSDAKSKLFSFWGGPQDAEGRWAAEEAVVEERIRRTRELMEDVTPPRMGIWSYFKA
ncbi:MFS maltose permease [Metarhizium brunneum]